MICPKCKSRDKIQYQNYKDVNVIKMHCSYCKKTYVYVLKKVIK